MRARARPRESAHGRSVCLSPFSLCLSPSLARSSFSLPFFFSDDRLWLSLAHAQGSLHFPSFFPGCLYLFRSAFLSLIRVSFSSSVSLARALSSLSVSNLESGRGGHSGLRDLRPSVHVHVCLAHLARRPLVERYQVTVLFLVFFLPSDTSHAISPRSSCSRTARIRGRTRR